MFNRILGSRFLSLLAASLIGGLAGGVASDVFSVCIIPRSEATGGILVAGGYVLDTVCALLNLPMYIILVAFLSFVVLFLLWVLLVFLSSSWGRKLISVGPKTSNFS